MGSPCDACAKVTPDLQAVIKRLSQLKREQWKGFVEYRLDGSGRIVRIRMHSYEKIEEHGRKRPDGQNLNLCTACAKSVTGPLDPQKVLDTIRTSPYSSR